jgi:hypothetical protein
LEDGLEDGMARAGDKLSDRLMASAAAFLLAGLCAVLAWWLFQGVASGAEDAAKFGFARSRRMHNGLAVISIFGVIAGAGALFFAAVGAYTLVKRVKPAPPDRVEDDPEYWKRFPTPKG